MIFEVLKDSLFDCLQMLPFLFAAFLILEAIEHYSGSFMNKTLAKVGRAGPITGAVLGCIPQCGFSVIAANLFSGKVITPGTLMAVLIATSDEAFLILLGHPGSGRVMVSLLLVKIVIGIFAGYAVDIFWKRKCSSENHELCHDCGCGGGHGGILMPALRHTLKIFLYLFLFTFILDMAMDLVGTGRLSSLLLKDSFAQPFLAAVIGLIPNCASSVMLTELFLGGTISFASVVAGLSSGAGIGLVVLFKMNSNKKENFKILGLLYGISVTAGVILQLAEKIM